MSVDLSQYIGQEVRVNFIKNEKGTTARGRLLEVTGLNIELGLYIMYGRDGKMSVPFKGRDYITEIRDSSGNVIFP